MGNPGCEALRRLLLDVERPSRYVGHEHNVVRKDPSKTVFRFALAFPDTYEIGMSHVGSRILYHVVNQHEGFVAERAYAPWPDMEARLRESGMRLYTLETYSPLSDFDVVGFSVQHELCYTNLLAMLELGGIPLKSADRTTDHPVIIAGGPAVVNPEPIVEFLDAVVLGDGEEVILEIGEAVAAARDEGICREELLSRLAGVAGVYVPSLFREKEGMIEPLDASVKGSIAPRVHSALGLTDFPLRPLVSLTEAIHDRLSIEIMRGCPQSCRFCQATQVYTPCRIRSTEAILEIAQAGIEHSGWDEISLVSLSTADYPRLAELASKLNVTFSGRNVALSLPSLRPSTFNRALSDELTKVRRTGLTFAPEAGTDRLRDAIGKPMSEAQILQALDTAFEAGHTSVKLYFMVGLPGERPEDLDGIAALGRSCERVARGHHRASRVHISVAPFVPKPHTPFQWAPFEDVRSLKDKELAIKRRLRSQRIRVKWRDPRLSFLEAVFSRGNRRLSSAIEAAYRRGARFDDWSDRFDFDLWMRAFHDTGIDPYVYTAARNEREPLIWEHLAVGRGRTWCSREWLDARELAGKTHAEVPLAEPRDTTDRRVQPQPPHDYGRKPRAARHGSSRPAAASRRIRMRYAKTDCSRYLSHLDVVRAFVQALRRIGVPLQYTEGYTPRPKLAFGHPLPLGVASYAELVDIWLTTPPPRGLSEAITRVLPVGMTVNSITEVFPKAPSLAETVNAVSYEARLRGILTADEAAQRLEDFMAHEKWIVQRRTKGRQRGVDLRKQVLEARLDVRESDPVLCMTVSAGGPGQGKPRDLLAAMLNVAPDDTLAARMDRTAQYVVRNDTYLSPMEAWGDA